MAMEASTLTSDEPGQGVTHSWRQVARRFSDSPHLVLDFDVDAVYVFNLLPLLWDEEPASEVCVAAGRWRLNSAA